jgi:hypothetical protein
MPALPPSTLDVPPTAAFALDVPADGAAFVPATSGVCTGNSALLSLEQPNNMRLAADDSSQEVVRSIVPSLSKLSGSARAVGRRTDDVITSCPLELS